MRIAGARPEAIYKATQAVSIGESLIFEVEKPYSRPGKK
jgi:hypothetical protein